MRKHFVPWVPVVVLLGAGVILIHMRRPRPSLPRRADTASSFGFVSGRTTSAPGNQSQESTLASQTQPGDGGSRAPPPTASAPPMRDDPVALHIATSATRDYYADAPVVASRTIGTPHDEIIRRVRIVRTDGRFPLIRVEDTLRKDSITGRPVLVSQVAMVADHIMVKLRAEADEAHLEAINGKLGGTIRRRMYTPGLYLVAFPEAELDTVPEKVAAYNVESGVVKYAEPDYLVYLDDTVPNDPMFGNLWGLSKIRCPAAWDIHTGRGEVVVGVVDSGVDYNHPDLAANMWRNPGEIPGNMVDDDNNGFVDDVYGWDFYDNDNDPRPGVDHGTHVAGTIAAVGNNSTGVVGVTWSAKLMSLKIGGEDTAVSVSAAVDALHYAAMMRRRGVNIRVTNHSWGGSIYVQSLRDAIVENRNVGILLVAAAGNDRRNNDVTPTYPASYNVENVIAVAATTSTDSLAWFSNYGATSVDLAAPGTSIWSTLPNNSYREMQGTSMATPHVSGVAALLCDLHPAGTWSEIRDAIFRGVDPVGALRGKVVTGGRLNALGAMHHLKPTILHVPLSNQINADPCYEIPAEISPSKVLNTNRLWLLWNTTGSTNTFVTNLLQRVEGNLYRGAIPTQSVGTTVFYWLHAASVGGETTRHPSGAPSSLHSFRVVQPLYLMVTGKPRSLGSPTPPYGLHTFPSGVTVTATAPLFTSVSYNTRYRCAGWKGLGSVPYAGYTNRVDFRLDSMSALEWNWILQYRLHQTSNVPGILSAVSWWDAGSTARTMTAKERITLEGVEYRFVEWRVDGERQPDWTNVAVREASLVMTNARTAFATYLPATTDGDSDGLPDWWERHYFGSTNAVVGGDDDEDGFSNTEEFLDGANPRDPQSRPTPPVILHTPLPNPMSTPAPWVISAVVTDNHAVSSVLLRWRRNEEEWCCNAFSPGTLASVWTNHIPAAGTNGDHFVYSIEAYDLLGLAATNGPHEFLVAYPYVQFFPNSLAETAILPNSTTTIVCRLVNRGNASLFWHLDLNTSDDIESGTNGWTLSGASNIWHISTNRFRSSFHAWYLGQKTSMGWRYTPSLHAELNTPPIRLWQRPRLTFWHWIAAELDRRRPHYAWDGGVVKISTNGTTFTQITPIGGYPYRISYWQPPQFPQDTPCFAGAGGWQQATFDLSAYEGKVVIIRFEFRGDDNTQEEGWYIDDLVVTSELNTNHWFFLAPTNGTVDAGSTTDLFVTLSSRGLLTGDRRSEFRVSANAPNAPRTDIPVAMLVRSPPRIEIDGAAQTSRRGEGLVTVVARLSDVDGDLCNVLLEYSLDGGTSWSKASVGEARVSFGEISVSNSAPEQLLGIATRVPGGSIRTNNLQVLWATTNDVGTVLAPHTLVRMRARDSAFRGERSSSAPFLVDNEPPSELPFLTVGTHQPGIWSTNNVVSLQWGTASDGAGIGVAGYEVLYTLESANNPTATVFFVTNLWARHAVSPDGTNWWVGVRAVDGFGNLGPVATAGPFRIDTTPPVSTGATIVVETSRFGNYVVGSTVTLSWSGFADNLAGISNYFFGFADGGGTTNGIVTTNLWGVLGGGILDRTNTVYVWAQDRVGLVGSAASRPILLLDPATDFDGDGYTTAEEEIAGTAADNADDIFGFLAITAVEGATGSQAAVSWPVAPGRIYTLYRRTGLTTGETWDTVMCFTNVPGVNGIMSYTDGVHEVGTGFYRVKVRLPDP